MRLKLLLSKEKYAQLYAKCKRLGIVMDNNVDLIVVEKNTYAFFLLFRLST